MKYFVIITGIITTILGIYGMCIPFRVFLGLGWLLGALMLVNGIEAIIGAFYKRKDIWQCLLGVLIAVGGCIILFNAVQRALTDVFLAYLVGGVMVAYGALGMYSGFKAMRISKGTGICGMILGVLGIIVGVVALTHPLITMISVGFIIAFNIMMQGINMTFLGFAIGKVEKDLKRF